MCGIPACQIGALAHFRRPQVHSLCMGQSTGYLCASEQRFRDLGGDGRDHNSKSYVASAVDWIAPLTIRATSVPSPTETRPATNHTRSVASRVHILSPVVWIVGIPVCNVTPDTSPATSGPFPHVSRHIGTAVGTVSLWRELAHRRCVCPECCTVDDGLSVVASLSIPSVAPGVDPSISTSRSLFPLGLRGQCHRQTGLLR
jgi:hypothetical protein